MALLALVKEKLTDGTLWEEYTEDDLAHYIAEHEHVTYAKGLLIICGVKFIISLEDEILDRKAKGTFCDCIPLLSPYKTPFGSLCNLSKVPLIAPYATPYTTMGLASIATIRLYHMGQHPYALKMGQGIPQIVSYYLAHPSNGKKQQIIHSKMRYKCNFCRDKYHPIHAKLMSRLLHSMAAFINKSTHQNVMKYGHPFVKIGRD